MAIVAIVLIVLWVSVEIWSHKVANDTTAILIELSDAYEALAIENERLKESLASYEAIIKRNFGEHL